MRFSPEVLADPEKIAKSDHGFIVTSHVPFVNSLRESFDFSPKIGESSPRVMCYSLSNRWFVMNHEVALLMNDES